MKPVIQSAQMNIFEGNTYKHDFDNEARVQKKKKVGSSSPDMPAVFCGGPDCRCIEIKQNLRRKKLHRMN